MYDVMKVENPKHQDMDQDFKTYGDCLIRYVGQGRFARRPHIKTGGLLCIKLKKLCNL